MLIPVRVDVPMRRWPIANWVVISIAVVIWLGMLVSYLSVFDPQTDSAFVLLNLQAGGFLEPADAMVLSGWDPLGLLGHIWIHAGLFHLVGNMLFLWVFGNAVCAKLGNVTFALLYVALGVAAGCAHLLLDGRPAVGASGAINGVVGMYLMLYPRNDVTMRIILFFKSVDFRVSGVWIILVWFAFDVWGALGSAVPVAYSAHLGGFAAGVAVVSLGLWAGLIRMDRGERSLPDWLGLRVDHPPEGMLEGRLVMKDLMTLTHPNQSNPTRPPARRRTKAAPTPELPEHLVHRCTCGAQLKAPRKLFGKTIRCPKCGAATTIPDPTA